MMRRKNGTCKAQVLYFSHGGGPLPILGDPGHKTMNDFLSSLPDRLRLPQVILVISAHWEESRATLLAAPHPLMFYDYYGFPPEAYQIQYPAPGDPELAERIATRLEQHGFSPQLDTERGFDHGLFIPLKLMYPSAKIPALQLSLLRGLDPQSHINLGKALRGLLGENILVIGSGFSFHNLQAFSWGAQGAPDPANDDFQDWLIETCTAPMTESARQKRLAGWEKAPSARYCHPREEHLLPLHVCAGLAGAPAEKVFDDRILGKRAVAFLWAQ
jgi:4,5-DOPA dioxygenase extradiol